MGKKKRKNQNSRTAYRRLLELENKIPYAIFLDTAARAKNWLRNPFSSEDDLYIQQQLYYAARFLKES